MEPQSVRFFLERIIRRIGLRGDASNDPFCFSHWIERARCARKKKFEPAAVGQSAGSFSSA